MDAGEMAQKRTRGWHHDDASPLLCMVFLTGVEPVACPFRGDRSIPELREPCGGHYTRSIVLLNPLILFQYGQVTGLEIERRIFVLTADDGAILGTPAPPRTDRSVGLVHHPWTCHRAGEVGAVLDPELVPEFDPSCDGPG